MLLHLMDGNTDVIDVHIDDDIGMTCFMTSNAIVMELPHEHTLFRNTVY